MFILQNNSTNSLRFIQTFRLLNDNLWTMTQKSNNVDYPIFTFRNGNICVGTTANPAYKLDVVGDVNITGDFRKNGGLYKPAEAVLANTATALATSTVVSIANGGTGAVTFTAGRLIVGDGAASLKQYTGLTWTTATNLLTATNISTGAITASGTISASGGLIVPSGNLLTANGGLTLGSTSLLTANNGMVIPSGKYLSVGATNTSDVDDNTNFAMPLATLYVKGGATTGGTCDVVIRGGVAGQNGGKVKLWFASDASHSSYIQSEHTGSGNTQLTFGTASGNALPTQQMIIQYYQLIYADCVYMMNVKHHQQTITSPYLHSVLLHLP
jgi:hypothetical protein